MDRVQQIRESIRMIMHPKPRQPRDNYSVAVRAAVVKAAMMANPQLDKTTLAKRIGLTRGMLNHYISGRFSKMEIQEWGEVFFAAACALAYKDFKGAADKFRQLADQLDPTP